MLRPLRTLIVEDNSQDAELLVQILRCAGFDPDWSLVDTEADYVAGLRADLDVILSDYALPGFSGRRALQLMRERGLELPFIIVSGTIGEDAAVATIKEGATDYVLKDRLTRLGVSVEHALEQGRLRRESKRTEEALILFRNLMDQSNDIIEVVDPETGRFLDVNERGCLEVGYTRAEYLSLRVFDIDPLVNEADWSREVDRIRATGSLRRVELNRRRRKDGTSFPIEVNARWIRLDRDYIVTVVRDITEREVRDRQIQEQARLLDLASDAICVHDLNDCVLYWNHGAERLFAWTAEEIIGADVKAVLYTDADAYSTAKTAVLKAGEWHGEVTLVSKDGRSIIASARWTLVRDEIGEPNSVLVISSDITEQKNLERRFLCAQRLENIGTLASGVAHDLNNILSPILMSVPLLRNPLRPATMELLVSTIESCAERGADIVKQVLTFARGIVGERTPLQPKHLVRQIEQIATETFPKNIQIRTIIPHDLWTVLGDPTQLHQVLLNLCVNARDAMPNGGALTLRAENLILDAQYAGLIWSLEAKTGPCVCIQITDTGTGIPPAAIEKIFDPFFTTKEIGEGTGLGLSTSVAILKSHGGFIRVHSELEKGTEFSVYLPAQSETTLDASAKRMTEMPRGNGELILIVDDEFAVREITQQTLKAFGYQVVLASDGVEAVAVYARQGAEIAAVFTDVMMPIMDGAATIQVLRRMNPAVRIIGTSGLSDANPAAQATSLGIKHFLLKPYSAEKLLKELQQVLTEAP